MFTKEDFTEVSTHCCSVRWQLLPVPMPWPCVRAACSPKTASRRPLSFRPLGVISPLKFTSAMQMTKARHSGSQWCPTAEHAAAPLGQPAGA